MILGHRLPVELLFTLEGFGVLGVLAAITILWGRSAKRERISEAVDVPTPPDPTIRENEIVVVNGSDNLPVLLKVQRIKWMADGKGATIFAGKHSVRKAKGFDSAILSPPTPNPNLIKVLIKNPVPERPKFPPNIELSEVSLRSELPPEEPKGDCPL